MWDNESIKARPEFWCVDTFAPLESVPESIQLWLNGYKTTVTMFSTKSPTHVLLHRDVFTPSVFLPHWLEAPRLFPLALWLLSYPYWWALPLSTAAGPAAAPSRRQGPGSSTSGHQDNQRQNSFYVTALFTLYSVWRQAAAVSPGCTGIVLLSASSFLLVCTGSFIIDWLLPSTGSCWC